MSKRTTLTLAAVLATALLMGCPPPEQTATPGAAAPPATAQAPATAPKSKVSAELYIMSKCPYGARAAIPMIEAGEELGGLLDLRIDYIVTPQGDDFKSLHGPTETRGDIDQLCAKQVDGSKFGAFVKCVSEDFRRIPENSKDCAAKVGIDYAALQTCAEGPEGKSLLLQSAQRATAAGARGSPTIKLAGQDYRGGRSKRDFMRAICAASSEKTAACAAIPEPAKVNLFVLNDKRCKDCDTTRYEGQLRSYFPGVDIKTVDYSTPEGKEMYQKTGVKVLPALLFDESVKKAEAWSQFERRMEAMGGYYLLRVRSEFDPTAEICDNGSDDTGNGLVDCADPTCKDTLTCREEKKGELSVFVMSQCPYGLKALDAMKPVLETLGGDLKFNIHYIADKTPTGFRALHGQPEVDENIRELCAIEHYGKGRKYMDYVWCRNKDIRSAEWEKCATPETGISADVIRKCFEGEQGKALLEKDIEIAKSLQIGASPTWLANNKYKFSGIQPEQIKSNFCRYNPGWKGCDQKLGDIAAPPAGSCK